MNRPLFSNEVSTCHHLRVSHRPECHDIGVIRLVHVISACSALQNSFSPAKLQAITTLLLKVNAIVLILYSWVTPCVPEGDNVPKERAFWACSVCQPLHKNLFFCRFFLLSCCTKQVLALRATPLLKSFSFTGQYFFASCSRRTDLEFFARVWAVAFVARSLRVHDSPPRLNTSCCLAVVFNWMKRGKERSAMLVYFSLKDGRNYRLAARKTGSM